MIFSITKILYLIQTLNFNPCIILIMMRDSSLNYAVLFGGGAIRGTAYCGAIKALEELNIQADILAGSSVGSILAGLLAVGYNAEDIRDIIMKVNFELFKDLQFGFGQQFALSKGEVFLEWIRDLIEKKYYGESYKKGSHKAVTFDDLEKDLVIITTDLSSFECKEFSKFETPDFEVATAIRISCSMPGLMKPVEYNNRVLIDGDLQKSAPMWKLSENLRPENARILEFRLEGDFEGKDKNTIEYLNSIYSYATCTGTQFISELYGSRDKYDYVIINTGDLNIVDFNISDEKREQLFKTGYDQTMSYFTKTLVDKKQKLLEIYSEVYEYLNKVDAALKGHNIQRAKLYLGDLYMYLCDFVEVINQNDYKVLNQFKVAFTENIRYPALFGKTSLKNEKLVQTTLQQCINTFAAKVNEYECYLK